MKDRDIASLVNDCRKGDEDSWAELVNRYKPMVYIMCRKNRLSADESDDIFCEVNRKVFETLDTLRSNESFIGFVYTTAKNEILHFHRANRTHRKLDNEIKEMHIPDPPESAEEKLLKEEREILVAMALEQLPMRCRKLINLIFNDENEPSLAEAAKLLKRHESAVRESLRRCYNKVKIFLKKFSEGENLLC
jgi:RNA polymerase sigma factor (sigma-70 family)